MVAGIFLNSVVVIISLWRSSQLRKKLCYFMILVLSCFDLAVITITHPLLIVSTIYFSQEEINKIGKDTKYYISLVFLWLLYVCTFYAECWTIPSPDVSIFPSSISHKNKASMFSGILDGYSSRSVAIGIFEFGNNCRHFCMCIYFIPVILVHLFKLQNFYNRQVKTRRRKGCSNYSDGWK
jgi:hypothetical protein